MQTVLVVDDDVLTATAVAVTLRREGYDVMVAGSGREALAVASRQPPQCAILELGLPDMAGVELCRELRKLGPMRVVFLTAAAEETNKATALGAGGDVYLTKPVSAAVLLGRVRHLLHDPGRAGPEPASPSPRVYALGEVRLDMGSSRLAVAGEDVRLSPRELQVLEVLLQEAGRVVPRAQLLARVWGLGVVDEHVLELFVRSLQAKMEHRLGHAVGVQEVDGEGYCLVAP